MPWEILLMHLPEDTRSLDDIEGEIVATEPIGSRAWILAELSGLFPALDLADPQRPELIEAGWIMDVAIGEQEDVDHVLLVIRGRGEGVAEAVAAIIDRLHVPGWDLGSEGSQRFELQTARQSWASFQRWRDQAPWASHGDPPAPLVDPG